MCRSPEVPAKAGLRTARRSVPATFVGYVIIGRTCLFVVQQIFIVSLPTQPKNSISRSLRLPSAVTDLVFRFVLLDTGCRELDPVVQFSHRKLAAEKRQ